MKRAGLFTTLCLGVLVAVGCGGSSEKEAEESATQTTQTTQNTQKKMTTQGPIERPRHLKNFGVGGTQLSRAVMDSLRVLKKLYEVTRDEHWQGEGGVLANSYFEIWYASGTTTVTHAMRVLNDMMIARAQFSDRFGSAPEEPLVIVLPPYLKQYELWTGREFWHYSHLHADTMTIQPVHILLRRGLIQYAIPHEYIQWALGYFTRFSAPRWLEEGAASYFTREGHILEQNAQGFDLAKEALPAARLDEILMDELLIEETRVAYYKSLRMVLALVNRFGEDKLIDLIVSMNSGLSLDEAFQQTYGISYEEATVALTEHPDGI